MDENAFNSRYKFMEEMHQKEIEHLKAMLNPKRNKHGKKTKGARKTVPVFDEETKLEMQQKLTKMQQKQAENLKKSKARKIKSDFMKKQRARAAEGAKPYYPKRSQLREMEMTEKFNELDKAGKLASFMAKRRKKNSNKDHRWLPKRRNVES